MPLVGSPKLLYDASIASSILLSASPASDGSLIDTWQDQSASAQHATQVTAGAQPFYDTLGIGSGPGIGIGRLGAEPFTQTWLNLPALSLTIPFTLYCLFRGDGEGMVAELSANIASAVGMSLGCAGSASGWAARVRSGSGAQNADTGAGEFWATDDVARVVAISHDGTTMSMLVNGVPMPLAVAGTAPGTGALAVGSGGAIGSAHGGSALPLIGMLGLLGVWDHAFSGAEHTQNLAYIQSKWTLPIFNQAQVYNVVGIGDSIMLGATTDLNGTQSEYPRSHVARAIAGLGFRFGTMANIGISGATITGTTTTWGTLGSAALVNGVKNLVVANPGVNDIPGFTISSPADATAAANTMLTRMQTLIQSNVIPSLTALSATGRPHQVVVETVQYGGAAFTALQDSARTQYNALILANAPGWTTGAVTVSVADVGGDLIMGTAAGAPPGVPGAQNPNFFTGLHPGRSGQNRQGGILRKQLVALGL